MHGQLSRLAAPLGVHRTSTGVSLHDIEAKPTEPRLRDEVRVRVEGGVAFSR